MAVFKERLKKSLESSHMTQKQLAEKAEVTEAAISNYLRGVRVPRGATLSRLANALYVTTDYLLGMEEGDSTREQIQLLQRNLQKLDPVQLKKAEDVLRVVFDDWFNDEDEQ